MSFHIIIFIESYDLCVDLQVVNIKNQLNDKDFLERKLNKSYLYLKARGPDEKVCGMMKMLFFTYKVKNI